MRINVSEATEEEIVSFDERVWRGEDLEHYGEPVNWVKKEFIFKATQNGEIVGYIKGKFEAGVVYIDTVIIAKHWRRKGIGKMLIRRAERFGKKLGTHKVFLFTMEEWDASRLYEKLGYKKVGNLPNHYLRRDFVIYSKQWLPTPGVVVTNSRS